jgi:hypothetical protein
VKPLWEKLKRLCQMKRAVAVDVSTISAQNKLRIPNVHFSEHREQTAALARYTVVSLAVRYNRTSAAANTRNVMVYEILIADS